MAFEAQKFRRVVTGHDENGVAKVIRDETAECILQRPTRPGVTLNSAQISPLRTQAEQKNDSAFCLVLVSLGSVRFLFGATTIATSKPTGRNSATDTMWPEIVLVVTKMGFSGLWVESTTS